MKRYVIMFLLLTSINAHAEIMPTINYVSEKTGIANWLLLSVAKVESNLNPYALNVAGQSYYPGTRAEAEKIINMAIVDGKSFDVGLMQINNWWFNRYELHPAEGLDLKTNIYLGAHILRYELQRNGFQWASIGQYHSKTAWRSENYAEKVAHYARYYRKILKNE
jgi:soluble lytic murein transglycosylase-like protein